MKVFESARYANAEAAIPDSTQIALPVTRIYLNQKRPGLPKEVLKSHLHRLAIAGKVEVIETPGSGKTRRYYRWLRQGFVYKTLDLPRVSHYNNPQRNHFSLTSEVNRLLQVLYPLRQSKVIKLWMEVPLPKSSKKKSTVTKKLVFFIPGSLMGSQSPCVLVSILNSGSCLISPGAPGRYVANLVLAGMPVQLAKVLITTLQTILSSPKE